MERGEVDAQQVQALRTAALPSVDDAGLRQADGAAVCQRATGQVRVLAVEEKPFVKAAELFEEVGADDEKARNEYGL